MKTAYDSLSELISDQYKKTERLSDSEIHNGTSIFLKYFELLIEADKKNRNIDKSNNHNNQ